MQIADRRQLLKLSKCEANKRVAGWRQTTICDGGSLARSDDPNRNAEIVDASAHDFRRLFICRDS